MPPSGSMRPARHTAGSSSAVGAGGRCRPRRTGFWLWPSWLNRADRYCRIKRGLVRPRRGRVVDRPMRRDADPDRGAETGRAGHVEAAPHLAHQLAGLECSDTVAGGLGGRERTEQLVADERGAHTRTVVLDLDDDPIIARRAAQR